MEYCLESVEEYSEGKIHKSESEQQSGNVITVYFINQTRENTRISRWHGVSFTMNEHAIANVYLYLSFLLRIMFVKIYFCKLAFTLKYYKLV